MQKLQITLLNSGVKKGKKLMINTEYVVIIDDNEDVWNLTQNIFEKERRVSIRKNIIRKEQAKRSNVIVTRPDNSK